MDDKKGSKRTKYSLMEHPKNKILVCFTATASGCKLKPSIILPLEQTSRNFLQPEDVFIHYQKGK